MAPVYLYTGPEFGMRDEAADAVIKALKKKFGEVEEHVYYLNETSIGQAISQLDNGNLFASATCVLCKNAELLKKKDEIALVEDWCKAAEASGEDSSALIFISDEISVDSKLDKLVPAPNKKKFWEMFDNQKIPWLTDYFRKNGYSLTDDAAQMILDQKIQPLNKYINKAAVESAEMPKAIYTTFCRPNFKSDKTVKVESDLKSDIK